MCYTRPRDRFRLAAWAAGVGLLLSLAGCGWLRIDDSEAEAHVARARAALASGNYSKVVGELRPLVRRRPQAVEARRLLVEAQLALDTIESRRAAEALLRELVVLEPDHPEHRYQLAKLLLRRGFQKYAFDELAALIRLAPDHSGAYVALADYYRHEWQRYDRQEDLRAMTGALRRGVELAPDRPVVERDWIMCLLLLNEDEAAAERAAQAVSRWPEDGWFYCLLGTALAELGATTEAHDAFESALARLAAPERQAFARLDLLVDPYERRTLADLDRDGWLDYERRYWKAEDPTPTTPVNERRVEHYRRVTLAHVRYRHPRQAVPGYDTARGEMLIRYGEPLAKHYVHGVVDGGDLVPPSWVHTYRLAEDALQVTFVDYTLSGRFYLHIQSLAAAVDLASYTEPAAFRHDAAQGWLQNAMRLALFPGRQDRRQELYLGVPVTAAWATVDTAWVEAVALDADWQEAWRQEWAVPASGFARVPGRGWVYQLDLDLGPGEYQVATLVRDAKLPARPDTALYRPQPTRVATGVQALAVPASPDTGLVVSDLELAYDLREPARPPFAKGGISVIPNPRAVYRTDELVYFYFEVDGLEVVDQTARYRLSYRVRGAGRGGDSFWARLAEALRVKTYIEAEVEEVSDSRRLERTLAIDIAALDAGAYTLQLRVTDVASGQGGTAEAGFQVVR